MRAALRGPATTAAFRRRSAQQTEEVKLAEQALARWRDDAARLARLRASARVAGIPTKVETANDLEVLTAACRAAGLRMPFLPTFGDSAQRQIALANPTRRLSALYGALVQEQRDIATFQEQIEGLSSTIERFDVLAAASDPDGSAAAAARRAVDEATMALTEASLVGRAVEKKVATEAASVAKAEAKLERSSALVPILEEMAEVASTTADLADHVKSLAVSGEAAEAMGVAAASALEAARGRQVARLALEERRDGDARLVERTGRLAFLEREWRDAQASATQAQAAAAKAKLTAEKYRGIMEQLRIELTVAEADLATARRKASEMADALATIAKHIGEHDEHCPVCATPFPPGALGALAEAAALGQDVEVMTRSRNVEELRRLMDEAASEIAAPDESNAKAVAAQSREEAAASSFVKAREEVASLLNAALDDDLVALASRRFTATTAELVTLQAEVALADPAIAELEADVAEAERVNALLSTEREHVKDGLAAAERRKTELVRMLADDPDLIINPGLLAARLISDRRALEDVINRHATARLELASALSAEASARQRFEAADAARVQTDRGISAARAERINLAQKWALVGLAGEPSGRSAAARVDELASRLGSVSGLIKEVRRLENLVRKTEETSELAVLEARMADGAGEEAPVEASVHERVLLEKLDKAQRAIHATEATQRAVNAYTEQLKGRADRFSADFLMPLNGLIDDFNRTLLSTPGETVQFAADTAVNRTALGMRLRYADAVDNSRYDTSLAPQLVLSEGQMAANGFSILCAASVAYRWSNWRALLLDDPLQHNDIIHAAAFADVMRNLVEFEGYQLLMSSHDRAEGEFLFRKFDAADLPCTMVTLTAPSRGGVVSEPPRRNAAASRLLVSPLAAVG